jgi:pSer/pThr/pTyr-binding forkhead associated (FHA) protein
MHGELIPLGGGDPIPLLKKNLLVGRRESCDIVLRFSNVSAHHCQLYCNGGYWYVKDLKSRNGIKVNGSRVSEKRLDPGDEIAIAKHRYDVRYSPYDLGAVGPPPVDEEATDMMKQSLLERAGLEVRTKHPAASSSKEERSTGDRYDILDDGEGQIKDPNRPV